MEESSYRGKMSVQKMKVPMLTVLVPSTQYVGGVSVADCIKKCRSGNRRRVNCIKYNRLYIPFCYTQPDDSTVGQFYVSATITCP